MQQLVDDGTADIISMLRPFLRELNLVKADGANSEYISCGLCIVSERPIRFRFPHPKEGWATEDSDHIRLNFRCYPPVPRRRISKGRRD